MPPKTYASLLTSPKRPVETAAIQELREIIDTTPLDPQIINPASKFVMITYWWGRGNTNYNTQYHCPDDVKAHNLPITRNAIRYDQMIDKWIASCVAAKCNYMVAEYPQFAKPGKYQMAINAKPLFIQKALEATGQRAVVYIDGDMIVNKYPAIFDMDNVDYMARGWNVDPRSTSTYLDNMCFDPYIFETSGGTMYFANSKPAKTLLTEWAKMSTKPTMQGKADDRILSILVTLKRSLALLTNIVQLPIEYLWLTQAYEIDDGTYMRPRDWSRSAIVISHPECLTGEEKATEQGAANNRNPNLYSELVEDQVECKTHGGIFYESIFFPSKAMVQTYQPYLRFLSRAVLYNDEGENGEPEPIPAMYVEPYYIKGTKQLNYGPYNAAVAANESRCAALAGALKVDPRKKKTVMVYEDAQTVLSGEDVRVVPTDVVPVILAILDRGCHVFYQPRNANNVAGASKNIFTSGAEFLAVSTSDNDLRPAFHPNSPMFFKSDVPILRAMLAMCSGDMRNMSDVFNSSYIFMSRIRCKWIIPQRTPVKTRSVVTSAAKSPKAKSQEANSPKTKTPKTKTPTSPKVAKSALFSAFRTALAAKRQAAAAAAVPVEPLIAAATTPTTAPSAGGKAKKK